MLPNWLKNIIRLPMGLYLVCVFCAILFIAPWNPYFGKIDFIDLSPLVLVVAILMGGLGCLVVYGIKKLALSKQLNALRAFRAFTIIGALVLIALQSIVVQGCYFMAGWDVGELTHFGHYSADYYSVYPNQLFLAGVFTGLNEIAKPLDFLTGYQLCVLVGCVQVTLSVLLIAQIARRLGGYATGYCCFMLAFLFVGLSPWILVPYSDTYGIFWVTFVLFCYVCVQKTPLKWFGILFGSVIGYAIKPTILFPLAAIAVVELIRFAYRKKRAITANHSSSAASDTKSSVIAVVVAAVLALVCASAIVSIGKKTDLELDTDKALSVTHYLMMGFNPTTGGVYAESDVRYSWDQPASDRQRVNMEEWLKRIEHLGPEGLLHLFIKKSLTNYADGTLAWEQEGFFYLGYYGQNESLKHFYGIGDGQENLFAPLFQALWFMILVGLIAFCFLRKDMDRYECVILLVIVMLSVFLLIFECRARYLYICAPCYVLLCVLGWRELAKRFRIRVQRISAKAETKGN